jgi:D-serine deaminase-like pyridoxal phosphate-dependent protein
MQNPNITKPTLLLDKRRALTNISRMASKGGAAGVRFRPHFKTHQSADVGLWFLEAGVTAITVSSVTMARYFAQHGWSDITIAFPVNLRELNDIRAISETIDLGVLVDSEVAVSALQRTLNADVSVWIKIDAGYHRAGMPWDQPDHIISVAKMICGSSHLKFAGILAHNGHTYYERAAEDIKRVHAKAMSCLLSVKDALIAIGVEACEVSIGDTPSCSVLDSFEGADEIRPGNFVFYDIMQTMIGSCTEKDIAIAVACPVVGRYPHRGQILIYGGAIHFSKERISDADGNIVFGYMATGTGESLGGADRQAPLISLSQEHGIMKMPQPLFDKIHIGDIILIFPIHSCLTCDLFSEYSTLEGEIIGKLLPAN